MVRWKAVAADVDGTLTERRGSLLISVEAVAAVRMLEASGITVLLVSGNSLPITAGLARYIGARGPSVAENGCVIFHEGRIVHVCEGRPPDELVAELESLGFRQSWQNTYRHHDLAFYVPRERLDDALRVVEKYGMQAYYSGYALHVQPPGGGKGVGVRRALQLVGVDPSETIAVGDGPNDIPLLEAVGASACPGDADERVKAIVDYVAQAPGGRGFAEIARLVVEGGL